MQLKSMYECVTEFALKTGNAVDVLNYEQTGEGVDYAAVSALRIRLILEELGETAVALHTENLVEIADGLADLMYVAVGAAVAYGAGGLYYPASPNSTLRLPTKEEAAFYAAALAPIAARLCFAISHLRLGSIGAMPLSRRAELVQRVRSAVVDLHDSINDVANTLGIPLSEVFWEVHRSNMSKATGVKELGEKYAHGCGKGDSYAPPDISGILRRHYPDSVKPSDRT